MLESFCEKNIFDGKNALYYKIMWPLAAILYIFSVYQIWVKPHSVLEKHLYEHHIAQKKTNNTTVRVVNEYIYVEKVLATIIC